MEVVEAMPQPQAPWARTATAGGLGLRIVCALATLATTASTGGFSSHPALWLVSCSPSRPWSCLPFPSCLEMGGDLKLCAALPCAGFRAAAWMGFASCIALLPTLLFNWLINNAAGNGR